jgi:2',3'-cyclic-nucleotide 2'-phosphodiesterase (5'-nucleotidase family)
MLRKGFIVIKIWIFTSCLAPRIYHQHSVLKLQSDSIDLHVQSLIKPYNDTLQKHLHTFICTNTQARLKTDTLLPLWMAHAMLQCGNVVHSIPDASVIMVLINKGAIRSGLPKDSLRTDHFFKLMPFENTMAQGVFNPQTVQHFLNTKHISNFYIYTFVRYNSNYIPITIPQHWNFEAPVHIISSNFVFDGGDGFNIRSEALHIFSSTQSIRSCLLEQAQKEQRDYNALKWHNNEP